MREFSKSLVSALAFGLMFTAPTSAQGQSMSLWPYPGDTQFPLAQRHLEQGVLLYSAFCRKCGHLSEQGCGLAQLDAVISEAREALRIDPGWAEAHDLLGNALDSKRLFDEAIAEYRTALRLHFSPDFPAGHYDLGVAFDDKGDFDSAIPEFREAVRSAPLSADANSGLGNAL